MVMVQHSQFPLPVGQETGCDKSEGSVYSFYSSTMSTVDVSVSLLRLSLIGLLILLLSTVCTGCYLNECICLNADIICENTDESELIFTESERFAANNVYISANQKDWMSRTCGLFPRLVKVLMLDGSPCPEESCASCR